MARDNYNEKFINACYDPMSAINLLSDPNTYREATVAENKNKRNLRFGRRFAAGLLSVGILAGATFGGFALHRTHEVNRVKGYLDDFLTEDNYVDLSCIDKSYDIKGFKGEYLREALEDSDIDYVRIDDTFIFDIYDGVHIGTFKTKLAYNEENDEYFDPIRNNTGNGLEYSYPEGFELVDLELTPEPFDYERLDGTSIEVQSFADESQRLVIKR